MVFGPPAGPTGRQEKKIAGCVKLAMKSRPSCQLETLAVASLS